ncbi:MAG: Thymidylate synthase complementing protein [Bacteriophage sp.]|nr:MAG: Thymidylate synthase complementing protein [Bacteriophage sp.]
MKIIEPKVELWRQEDAKAHVARCARVCYGREIGNDEATIKRLINSKHWSMFRHETVYAMIPIELWYGNFGEILKDYKASPYISWVTVRDYIYVSTNGNFMLDIEKYEPVLYNEINNYRVSEEEFNSCEIAYNLFARWTFCVDTQISTSRELNRVSPNSIAEMSTRYIGFSDKQPIYEYDLHTEQGIIDAYLAGHSINKIDKYSGISHNKIRDILVDNNITIRNTASMVNHDAFKNINSHEKAYLLGLIETDGNIRLSHNEINITQHKDYYLYIKAIMSYVLGSINETNDRNCKKLYCFSNEAVNDLINIGIVENKTYKQTDEDSIKLINAIPKEFYPSFIRGIFDGDGCIGFYKDKKGYDNMHFYIAVHTNKLASFIENIIKTVINKDSVRITYRNGLYYISLHSKRDIIAFGNYMYSGFSYPFGHPDKTARYINFLQNNTNINYNFPISNFGDDKFKICIPHWISKCTDAGAIFTYILGMYASEETYKALINDYHLHRQDARGVLPLDTATRCVYTYSINEWRHILDLRYYGTTGKPHPNAKLIAGMIRNNLMELGYDFRD